MYATDSVSAGRPWQDDTGRDGQRDVTPEQESETARQSEMLSVILCPGGKRMTAADSDELPHYSRFSRAAESLPLPKYPWPPKKALHFPQYAL